MKINKVIIIFLLIISLFSGVVIASEVSAAENNIYVSLSGDDSSGNGSSDNPYNSIGKAINQSTDSDKNIIYLDEGIYKGDNNTKIEISKFHKNQEGSISIIGKGVDKTYIDGSSISYLFNISSNSIVYLHNLTILNCTNINGGAIVNYGTLTITNCNFENNNATQRGGAIWNNGTLVINNSRFKNNQVTTIQGATNKDYGGGAIVSHGALEVYDSIFDNNIAANNNVEPGGDGGAGGAILILDNINNVLIYNSTFTRNNARHGGAIMFFDNEKRNQGIKTIDNCKFEENTALYAALAIYSQVTVSNSIFNNNIATGTGSGNRTPGGAAINVLYGEYGANATIINCNFTNNTAINLELGSEAGAIGIYNNATALIKGCNFINNTATQGGAIYNSKSNTKIENCNFTYNTATQGGAIWNNNILSINTCKFENNNATQRGGAIWNNGTTTITDTMFKNNQVTTIQGATGQSYGGGAIVSHGALEVYDSIFDNNIAASKNEEPGGDGGSGGAILILNNINNVIIYNSTFTRNNARHGGAIMFFDSEKRNQGDKIIDRCTFDDNSALYSTVLIYSKVTVSNSTFNNNTALGLGSGNTAPGAAAINVLYGEYGANATIINCNFTNNKVIDEGKGAEAGAIGIYNNATAYIENCNFINNTAKTGGAIYVNNGILSIIGSKFINNTATFVTGSTRNYGGAININIAGIVNIKDSSFISNNATEGGAIYNDGKLNIINSNFTNNTAKNYGAGISNKGIVSSPGIINITGSKFIGNVATNGSAIYSNGNWNNITINNSSFINNNATKGGTIYNTVGAISISASEFISNSASEGGAICNYGGESSVLNITNSNFISNNATQGGAIYNAAPSAYTSRCIVNINNSNFENNTAAERGGAIWNNGMLKLKNNTMNNCFASTEGHYIYNNGSIDTVKLTLLKNETIKIIKGDISLYVLVTDDKGNNISGGNFTFLLGDERFNAIVTEGLAKYDLSITTLGKYLLSGEYYSNYTKGNLISIYTSEILVVKNTSININSVNGKRGVLFNLIATLKDEEGNPISDKVVKFYVNNVYIGNSITNVNGIAKFSYISYSYGKLIVKTVFEGDNNHISSENNRGVNVANAKVIWKVNNKMSKSTIQSIINKAASNDIILFAKGTYKGLTLSISKTLDLRTNGTVNLKGINNKGIAIKVNTNAIGTSIRGFSIQNYQNGIYNKAKSVNINSNKIYSNAKYGIYNIGKDTLIRENTVKSNIKGIYSSVTSTIKYNTLKNCKYGLILSKTAKSVTVYINTVYKNSKIGICILGSKNKILKNKISYHKYGIYIKGIKNTISKNIFTKNTMRIVKR